MPDTVPPTPRSADSTLGAQLFNRAWDLLQKDGRTPEEDAELVHTAHASICHWLQAQECSPQNIVCGEWQCARVYAVLARAEPALYHARRAVAVAERSAVDDWALASAYEALARAAACAGERALYDSSYARAAKLAAIIENPDDRAHIQEDLRTEPWFGMTPSAA